MAGFQFYTLNTHKARCEYKQKISGSFPTTMIAMILPVGKLIHL